MSIFKKKGFTIVELLIVIVVIGVLSTITVVSYNGFTARARNVARVTAAKQALQSVQSVFPIKTPLEVRATLNLSSGWYRACFGTGYTNIGGTADGDCGSYGSSPYVSESAAFNTMMQTYASLPSMKSYPPTTSTDGDKVSGPYLGSAWVDSKDMMVIEYSLEGAAQSCTLGPLVYPVSGGSSLTPAVGQAAQYSTSAYGVTECVVVATDTVY